VQRDEAATMQYMVHVAISNPWSQPKLYSFNRIDLPLYATKEDLKEKVEIAITMVATGFDLE